MEFRRGCTEAEAGWMKPTFITSNPHKFAEVRRILGRLGIDVRRENIRYTERRGEDVAEIAADSARWLRGRVRPPFFVEDTGLFIDALGGFPGAYSAWVLQKIGRAGVLRLLRGARDRRAAFRSAVALWDGRRVRVFEGEVRGTIALSERGSGGFGYDPIFIPRGEKRTFAEMRAEEKDALSSRGRALAALVEFLSRSVRCRIK